MEARWSLFGFWESVTAEDGDAAGDGGRFLNEPLSLTSPPFRTGLLALWTWAPCCSFTAPFLTAMSASLSAGRRSQLQAAERGSRWLRSSVLVAEGAFPLALKGWCPPLLSNSGSPLESVRAMIFSPQVWDQHRHSFENTGNTFMTQTSILKAKK